MKRSVWVEPRTRPDTYSLRWHDPITGEKKRAKVESKEELKKKRREIEDRLDAFKPGIGDPKAIPLVVMENYFTDLLTCDKPRRKSTLGMKRENLTPFLETLYTMEQLTTDKIKTYSAAMTLRGLAVDTIAIRLRDIRAFCFWTHKKGILGSNPWLGNNIPVSTFVGRRLTQEELQALFSCMSERLLDFLGLKFDTGARKGELLALEFNDIDFPRRYWEIRGLPGKSKSHHDRIVPLTDKAIEILEKRQKLRKGFVFEGYTKNMIQRDLRMAKLEAKIQGRIRPHDFRHTWASLFAGRRDSLKAIAGWKSEVMINRYRHTEVQELREDMDKGLGGLGQILGRIGIERE